MSPLFTNNGKLLQKDGKLATDIRCCCGGEYGIFICNSNSILDDDFDVFLNGNFIGKHIAPNGIVGGEFWRTNNLITRQVLTCANCLICDNDIDRAFINNELCDVCANSLNINDQLVNKNLFINGVNSINMINTKINGAGNYGRIWVFKFSLNPISVTNILLSDAYSGVNGQSFGPYNFII